MGLIVQKYGGTSVGSTERIRVVAQRVMQTVQQGYEVVVVVSAMGKETDRLVGLAHDLAPDAVLTPAHCRELDMLLSTGEQVSMALLAMTLQRMGQAALSMTGPQAGILTTEDHARARILSIQTERIRRQLDQGSVVIVAGFQGTSHLTDLNITTLGRGGSDTTAVALAAALQADWCEIYTDVDGVLTTDPRIVPQARLLSDITSDEMLELASLGAKVLHPRAVEIARNFGVQLKVQSSLADLNTTQAGTRILSPPLTGRIPRQIEMNDAVDHINSDTNQAKIVLLRVPDRPGIAAHLFQALADHGVNVDMILQSIHTTAGEASNDIAFTVLKASLDDAIAVAHQVAHELNCPEVLMDADVAKVSIGGAGMMGRPSIAADMFEVLATAGINLQMIAMSEMKVSCIIAAEQANEALLRLLTHFEVMARNQRSGSLQIKGNAISGVALDANQARLAILQISDQPGSAARVFRRLAQAGIIVDTIIQSQRDQSNADGIRTNDIAFTVPKPQASTATRTLQEVAQELSGAQVIVDDAIAKVSIVGARMEDHPGIAARMFQSLADVGINIEMIATSEIKVSCVVRGDQGAKALQVIHDAFELDLV